MKRPQLSIICATLRWNFSSSPTASKNAYGSVIAAAGKHSSTIASRMIAQQRGSTVNISSVDGLRGVNALAAYVSSKWGVRGLTKVAALELGHQAVRVNSIHPGGVNTAMSNPTGVPLDEVDKHYTHVPLQRVGLPDEIARATLFLASDEASYCNGAELAVDGGMAAGTYYPGLPGAPL